MTYTGNTPTQSLFTPRYDVFSGDGLTTTFTLSRVIASNAQIIVVVNNVPQNPDVAFVVSGNQLIFTEAPTLGMSNIFAYFVNSLTTTNIVPNNSVGPDQMSASLVSTPTATNFLRGDNTWSPVSGGGVTTFSAGSTGFTPNSATSGAIVLAGALNPGSGGTGVSATPTNGQLLIGNGTSYTLNTLSVANGLTVTNTSGNISVALPAPGASGNVLTSNGTTWASAAAGGGGGNANGQAFTSNGTFTIPAGVTAIKVTLIGGGAGGGSTRNDTGSFAGGGGAGAVGIQYFSSLTPGNTISVTVGTGGGSNAGGGTTSISSGTQSITTTSVTGGSPGQMPPGVDSGAAGGAGGSTFVNTLLSFPGGAGGNGGGNSASGGGGASGGGPGINSIGGGGAWGQGAAGISARVNGNNAAGYGNGGSGGGSDNGGGSRSGGSGSNGLVLIEW